MVVIIIITDSKEPSTDGVLPVLTCFTLYHSTKLSGAQAEEAFLYQRSTQSSQAVVQLSHLILKLALIMKHLFILKINVYYK